MTTLTTTELARYLGCECQYCIGSETRTGTLGTKLLFQADTGEATSVKPILKRLANLTDEHAKGCFWAAYGSEADRLEIMDKEDGWRLIQDGLFIDVYPNGDVEGGIVEIFNGSSDIRIEISVRFSGTNVVNYLRSQCYDVENLILRKVAIPKKP